MEIKEAILTGQPLPCRVIDAHTHMCAFTDVGYYQYHPDMVSVMRDLDRYGVDTIVTAPHPLVGNYPDRANRIARDLIRNHPGRVWGWICVSPLLDIRHTETDIAQYIHADGFVGFKFLPGYHGSLLAPGYECALEIARAEHKPVLTHTWAENVPFAEVETVLKRFPDVAIIIGHGGGRRETYRKCIELSRHYPNLYLEICGSLYVDIWLEDVVAEMRANRVIYGTDMINVEPRLEIGRVGLASISEEEKRGIFAENFLSLIRRPA